MKSCPHNFLELKPMYFNMSLVSATLFLEVGILYCQKLLGPKALLPAFMKKLSYNYYIDKSEIDKNNYNVSSLLTLVRMHHLFGRTY
jgi:hypothetical protein